MKYAFLCTLSLLSLAAATLPAHAEELQLATPKPSGKAILITAEEEQQPDDTTPENSEEVVADPIEPVNRGIHHFNDAVDTVALQPLARTYRTVVPEYGQDRIHTALHNLSEPVTLVNNALQGNVDGAFGSFWRFVINSTVGIGGMFDVAEKAGLDPIKEDFGQTLGTWGMGEGAYVELPLLGPSTVRDTVGKAVDSLSNPFNYMSGGAVVAYKATDIIDTRANLLDITDDIERTSFDPYSTYKSAYIQRRNQEIIRQADPVKHSE